MKDTHSLTRLEILGQVISFHTNLPNTLYVLNVLVCLHLRFSCGNPSIELLDILLENLFIRKISLLYYYFDICYLIEKTCIF